MGSRMRGLAALLLGVCLSAQAPAPVQVTDDAAGAGNIAIMPPRLVLEGGHRSGEILLLNTGKNTGHYQISFIHMDMDEKGVLQRRGDDQRAQGETFADDLVRFSPREVTLKPGETQSIRFRLRKPADLKDGEYRAHLLIKEASGSAAASVVGRSDKGQLSIRIRPDFSFAIPIIIRQGKIVGTSGLADWKAERVGETAQISGFLTREGLASIYGDIEVFADLERKNTLVGEARGVGVYPPLAKRPETIKLDVPAKSLEGKQLKIQFKLPGAERYAVEVVIPFSGDGTK